MLEFRMPQFGMGMTDGTIIRWFKNEGETVTAGELLVEIEAAKTTVEVEAPTSGVLARILVAADENVPVNTPIAMIAEAGEALPASGQPIGNENDTLPVAPASAPDKDDGLPSDKQAMREEADIPPATPLAKRAAERDGIDLRTVEGSGARGKVREADVTGANRAASKLQIEPRARRAAKQLGVELRHVQGTGPGGRVTEEDVRDFASRPEPVVAPDSNAAAGRVEKHSSMRRTIARRLTESKHDVPHFYLRANCAVDRLLDLRAELNSSQDELKISVNDLIVRAVALALKRVPAANVSWMDEGMLHHPTVDVSVAVATSRGLVTPVVREVDTKPILVLSREIKAMADRGREGKLQPKEYEGGSSSVSNLGMYGTEEFAAIINPPQATIFAIGAAEPRARVENGAVVAATMMTVTLSVDHRAVDGAVAAQLLAAFKSLIERPALILV